MKKLLLAGLAGATALATVTPAQAGPGWHYVGGCGFVTLSDGTESSQTKWDGEFHAAVIATTHPNNVPDPTVEITIECELRVNGASRGIIPGGSATGTGVAGTGGQFSFHAHPDDIVTMCDLVTVNGEFHKDCGDATTTPIVPEQVQDLLDEHVWPTVDPTIGEIDETLVELDATICTSIILALNNTAVDDGVIIDIRSDGDIYILGEWFWDCPQYGESGPPGS